MSGERKKKKSARKAKPQRKAFLLRLSPELMEELRGWAAQDFRSLNGQIEFLLRQAVKRRARREEDGE